MATTTQPHGRDGRAARWAGQHERRRAEFVAAALTAIAEHGPDVSTERIAAEAGVARTRLYKHFDGADDLRTAITTRVTELLDAQLEPVRKPHGTPRQMITVAYESYLDWVIEHQNLYRYLLHYGPHGGWDDIRTTLGDHLAALFTTYLTAFGADTGAAQSTAFGLIGYAESATNRWLDDPDGVGRNELVAQVSESVWALLDHMLRTVNVALDPDEPLS